MTVIAQVARVDPAGLTPESTLARIGLKQSLGLSLLRSALERRFERRLSPLTWQMTIAQVLAILDDAAPPAAPAPVEGAPKAVAGSVPRSSGPFGGRTRMAAPIAPLPALGHGVDIQDIAALPEMVGDRTAEAFYQEHFTAAELAAARLRPDARTHLCGLWCAKEAVRKSDPDLVGLAFSDVVVEEGAAGRPVVRLARDDLQARFTIIISISHSAAYAVASAITLRR